MKELAKLKPDFIVNIAASPFSHSRIAIKKQVFIDKAKKYQLPLIYVNQVGAQTQLIFEGGSMAIDNRGEIVEQLNFFTQDVRTIDLEKLTSGSKPQLVEKTDQLRMMHDALITGIRGYFSKMGFSKAVVGLSGGIDSAVTLVLAAKALGKSNVHAIMMPSEYSSDHSITDSERLVQNLGMSSDKIRIHDIFDAYR